MGTLGATAPEATAVAVDSAALDAGGGVVNGPEDLPDWDAIDWGCHEEQVQRLRQRIFKAAQAGDLARVRNLQKLMLRSLSNTLVSVARVTERNTGRLTAGVDGLVALTAQDRAELAMLLHRHGGPGQALPVRRVYIRTQHRLVHAYCARRHTAGRNRSRPAQADACPPMWAA